MIRQISILPARPLRPYISRYRWIGSKAIVAAAEEDSLPFPASGLCFQFGGAHPVMITHGDTEKEALPAGYVLPPSTTRFTVHYQGGQRMLAAIFRPGAFFEFFGWPLYYFTGRTVPFDDADDRHELITLREKLEETDSPEHKASVLDAFFLQKLKDKRQACPAIRQAVRIVTQGGGVSSTRALAKECNVSARHLRRLFNQYVGMSPRTFLRIYRFYQAYWALASGRYDNLTTLALDAGYFDQAHFIHDFRYYTGLSPHQFLEREFNILDKVAWKNGQ